MFSFELTSSVQLSPPKNDSGKRVPEQATSGGGGEGGEQGNHFQWDFIEIHWISR
jgi:hypothetical protein